MDMKKSSTLINLFKQLPLTAAEIVAFAFFCFLFPLGQLGRLTLFNGGALYAHEAAMLLWITLTAHELLPVFFSQVSRITQEKFLYHNKLEIAFLVWASIGIVYAYLRIFDLVSILYLSRLIFY